MEISSGSFSLKYNAVMKFTNSSKRYCPKKEKIQKKIWF